MHDHGQHNLEFILIRRCVSVQVHEFIKGEERKPRQTPRCWKNTE